MLQKGGNGLDCLLCNLPRAVSERNVQHFALSWQRLKDAELGRNNLEYWTNCTWEKREMDEIVCFVTYLRPVRRKIIHHTRRFIDLPREDRELERNYLEYMYQIDNCDSNRREMDKMACFVTSYRTSSYKPVLKRHWQVVFCSYGFSWWAVIWLRRSLQGIINVD